MTKSRSIRLAAPGPMEKTYRVLAATNILDPVPGEYISRERAKALIDLGVKVVIIDKTVRK